jgi:hypothetical protein
MYVDAILGIHTSHNTSEHLLLMMFTSIHAMFSRKISS